MKTRLLITGIIGIMVILVIFIIGSNFAESKELSCLHLYKDINEISRTPEFALAEGETIAKHRNWIFEYMEKDCPDFRDFDYVIQNYYNQNLLEVEPAE